MSFIGILALILCSTSIFIGQRRHILPVIAAATCLLTIGENFKIGPLTFGLVRFLILVAHIRLLTRREWSGFHLKRLDYFVLIFGFWLLLASLFHGPTGLGIIPISGYVFNVVGIYFIVRVCLSSWDDVLPLISSLAILLTIVAVEMVYEQISGRNLFSIFGSVAENVGERGGRFRAQGPFRHAILAGTVGATCTALFIAILKERRSSALIGIISSIIITICSASSGPLMALFVVFSVMFAWRYRHLRHLFKWGVIGVYLFLELFMPVPAYYIMARIDLTGSSTGWHRARLIEAAIEHFGDWWKWGTDYTRDWMPTGVTWSENHTDITNYFLFWGVLGGVIPFILIVLIGITALSNISRSLDEVHKISPQNAKIMWCICAYVCGHLATSFSVAYFDQSFVFIWLGFAVAASVPDLFNGVKAVPENQ